MSNRPKRRREAKARAKKLEAKGESPKSESKGKADLVQSGKSQGEELKLRARKVFIHRTIKRSIPTVISILFWGGMQMTGIVIPVLGYVFIGLAAALLVIPAWPFVKSIAKVIPINRHSEVVVVLAYVVSVGVVVSLLSVSQMIHKQVPSETSKPNLLTPTIPAPSTPDVAPSNQIGIQVQGDNNQVYNNTVIYGATPTPTPTSSKGATP